jgi:isoquinoline 1-oxidoreductase alpha subunit
MPPTQLVLNGEHKTTDADPHTPLLWVLREGFGLTAAKYGCGIAQCGACTVHLDGAAIRACVTPLSRAAGIPRNDSRATQTIAQKVIS